MIQLKTPLPSEIDATRAASRRLVRELGFMRDRLAGTALPASAVHALLEIHRHGSMTAAELSALLNLEKSSVSRLLRRLIDGGEVIEHAGETDGRTKPLLLTPKGQAAVAGIDSFAQKQVGRALTRLMPGQRKNLAEAIDRYADALAAERGGAPEAPRVAIRSGYRPGAIARCVEMHALFYAARAGFGRDFEAKVAAQLAEFTGRLDRPCNQLWLAVRDSIVVGSIAIDGEDMAPHAAHLRWFIVADGGRGSGIGRKLLSEAVAFCDRQGFAETRLSTFRGLDAARHLYEAHGFALAEERAGQTWGVEVIEQSFVRQGRPLQG